MVLKLYKKEDDRILYWEAWSEDDQIIIHFGQLGDQGETTSIGLAEFEPPDTAIGEHAQEAREAGFSEIDHDELFELIIQYPAKRDAGFGTNEELGYQIEQLLSECLGWTGLGYCDGSESGDGALNVYCYVIDPKMSAEKIVAELKASELLGNAVIAYQDKEEQFVVLWPEGYTGVFEY